MQIKKGVEGNLLRTLINHYTGCSVKGWYLVQVRDTHSAESTDFRGNPLSHLSKIKMTESGWFRIVPQQSGEVSLNHQG